MTGIDNSKLNQLYGKVGNANYDSKAELQQKFSDALKSASSGIISLGDNNTKHGVISTDIDSQTALGKTYIVDGGGGKDSFLIDNYKVNSAKDIKIETVKYKNSEGQEDSYQLVTVQRYDANGKAMDPHTYRLTNFESISFVDKNNNVKTLDIKNSIANMDNLGGSSDREAGFYNDMNYVKGIAQMSSGKDVAVVEGKAVSFNMKGGDDTVYVTNLAKPTYNADGSIKTPADPDQLAGGAGKDTIVFTNMTESDIKSITYNRHRNYTITTMDGGVIQFKDFENIKIGNNTYKVDTNLKDKSDTGISSFTSMFNEGKILLNTENSEMLTNGKGMKFGYKDDTIVINDMKTLSPTQSKNPFIDGGDGNNTIDLSSIKGLTIKSSKMDNNNTLNVTFMLEGNETTVVLKNIQNIKLANNNNYIIEKNQVNGKDIINYVQGDPIQTPTQKDIKGSALNWTANGNDPHPTLSGVTGIVDNLQLDGKLEDYKMTYVNTALKGQPAKYAYKITKKENPSEFIYIDAKKSIEKITFTETGKSYKLVGNDQKMLGDVNLSQFSFSTINFTKLNTDSSGNEISTEGDDYFSGTAINDKIDGLAGDDIFAQSAGNDVFDGGAGTDTFIASQSRDKYTIYKDGDIITVIDNTTKNTVSLENVERIIFADSNQLNKMTDPFYFSKFKFDPTPSQAD